MGKCATIPISRSSMEITGNLAYLVGKIVNAGGKPYEMLGIPF